MATVLVVEDQAAIRDLLLTYLRLDGHSADGEGDAEAALSAFQSKQYDLVVTDLMLPGHDGLWLLQEIQALGTDAKVILSTGYDGADVAVTALRQGAFDYVVKPVDSLAFKTKVREALTALEAERRSRGAEDDALRRSQELTTLNTVGTLVHASLNPIGALGGALNRVLEVLRLPTGFIWLSGDGGVPETLVSSGVVETRPGALAASARAWLDDGDDRCPVEEWGNDGMEPAQTWCLAPVVTSDVTFGVVAGGLSRGSVVPDSLSALLEAVGRQIGMALANGVTYSHERRRAELLHSAADASREVFGAREVDEAVERALVGAMTVLPANRGTVIGVGDSGYEALGAVGIDRAAVAAEIDAHEALLNGWRSTWPGDADRAIVFDSAADPASAAGLGGLGLGGRSVLVARLRNEVQLFGFLVLASSAVGSFGAEDIESVTTYADLAGAAIANAHAFERLERQSFEEQWALLDISTRLLGVLDIEASCRAVLDVAVRSLRADHCTIYLGAPDGGMPLIASTLNTQDEAGQERLVAGEGSAAAYVARMARPSVSPDLANEERFEPLPASVAAGMHCELLVPMVCEEEVAGVLVLSWAEPRAVSPRETRLASLLAHQAAIGAAQARLYEAVVAGRAALSSANDGLRVAYDALARQAMVIEGATRLTSEAIQAADADRLHQQAAEFALRAVSGESAWVVSLTGGEPRTWTAQQSGASFAPAIADAVMERLRRSGRPKRWAPRGRSSATIAVPLLEGGQLLGAIGVSGAPGQCFNDDDVKILASLGHQTMLAGRSIGLYRDLELAYDQTLNVLVSALEVRERETEQHSDRARRVTLEIAAELEYREGTAEWVELSRGAVLHDIGKIGVADAILRKAGPLTEDEWSEMRRHPEFGYNMLLPVPFLHGAAEMVLCHHERWDGEGYPRRLSRDEIPLGARIFAVADAFDAMTSARPYRAAMSPDHAVDEILRCRGAQFDPEVVDAFIRFSERLTPAEVLACGDPANGRHIAA